VRVVAVELPRPPSNRPTAGGNSFPVRLAAQFSDHCRLSGSKSRRVGPFAPRYGMSEPVETTAAWTLARVPIESVGHATAQFLRLGTDIEVLEPPELRARMARTIAELAERYGNPEADHAG
jgi:predicted DNA-binding transcriptional regulator YafY